MTVIELMFAMAMIGFLLSIATTRYQKYAHRAKRAEAIFGLAAIDAAERSVYLDRDEYVGTFTELEFDVTGGQRLGPTSYQGRRYVYSLSQPFGVNSWYCAASADLDGDSWLDVVVAYDVQPP